MTLDALVNLRDLGEGGPLPVSGMLLRSDAPLSTDKAPFLGAWPPATVIDLRGAAERREPHPLAGAAHVVELPLLGGRRRREATDEPREQLAESGGEARAARRWPDRLAAMYLGFLKPPLSDLLVEAIGVIARADPPVLVHCSAGKDRTGVTIALALSLVGIEREAIVADYLLTEQAMPQVLARMQATVSRATEGTSLATLPPHIAATPREAMTELLDVVEAHEGGSVGWFLEQGGTEETVALLRTRLLGPDRPL